MEVKVENGHEVIDIISDGFVHCVKIHRPIVADWYDCSGSVGKYYAVANLDGAVTENLVKEINQVLIDGKDGEIFSGIKKFMRLFSSGNYTVTINRTGFKEYELIYADPKGDLKKRAINWGYYPQDECFVFTQPFSTVDNQRVAYYAELIRNGLKPKPVVLHSGFVDRGKNPDGTDWVYSNNSAFFILDGHHKFMAYKQLGVDPEFVLIEKQLKGEDDFFLHKDNLYFQMEWLLDDFHKKHIISHTAKIFLDATNREINYNQYLDEYLKETNYIETSVTKILLEAFNKNEPGHSRWLIRRLEMMRQKIIGGGKYWLNFKAKEKQGWQGKNCETLKDFDDWCVENFHAKFDELKSRLQN